MQNLSSMTFQKSNLPFPAQGDAMLASVVIHLEAMNDEELLPETGRKVHGFWHDQWKQVSPQLADEIHPENSLPSFTLTPLMGLDRPEKNGIKVNSGRMVWFRMTTLQPELSESLFDSRQGWLCSLPAEITLGPINWKPIFQPFSSVDAVWSWVSSYQSLVEHAKAATCWKIELATPTAFSGRYVDFTFPLPENLIGSWLKRWNTFCPDKHQLPESLIESAKDHLRITHYRLATRKGERNTTGCQGNLTIRAYELSSQIRKQLDIMFQYAFFCGSGHRTAQGMGITRLLPMSTQRGGKA